MVQYGLNAGVKNICKAHAILHILKMKGTWGAATQTIPKKQNKQNIFEN